MKLESFGDGLSPHQTIGLSLASSLTFLDVSFLLDIIDPYKTPVVYF